MNYRRQGVCETTTKIIRQATRRNNTRCKSKNKTSMNSKTAKVISRINSKRIYIAKNNKYESQ